MQTGYGVSEMKKNKCPLCGGEKKEDKTIYSVDTGSGIVVVRNVPCFVCIRCGEEWIDRKAAEKLESIVNEAKIRGLQTEILSFPRFVFSGIR